MKSSKLTAILITIIVMLLVFFCGTFTLMYTGIISFNKVGEEKETGNKIEQKEENKTEKQEEVKNESTSQQLNNSNNNTAILEIKKCLKDESWLKQNIYIKDDEKSDNESNISDQVIEFNVCNGTTTKPIIVITTSSDNAKFTKTDLITYENGKVVVKRISQGHIYHGGSSVDIENNIVCSEFMHMGDHSFTLRSIKDGNIIFLGMYGIEEKYSADDITNINYRYYVSNDLNGTFKDVTKEEYEEYKNKIMKKDYNFNYEFKELTSSNIERYIK